MAKRIHRDRKKMYEDEFVQKSGEFITHTAVPYVQHHQRQLVYVVGGVVGVLFLGALIFAFTSRTSEQRQAALDRALVVGTPAPGTEPKPSKANLEAYLAEHKSGTPAAWANFYLADILLDEGQADKAIEHYQKFIAGAPSDAEPLGRRALAWAQFKAGRTEEAIASWKGLRDAGWSSEMLDVEMATARLGTAEKDAAIGELRAIAAKTGTPWASVAKERLQLYAPEVDASLVVKSVADPPTPVVTPGAELPTPAADASPALAPEAILATPAAELGVAPETPAADAGLVSTPAADAGLAPTPAADPAVAATPADAAGAPAAGAATTPVSEPVATAVAESNEDLGIDTTVPPTAIAPVEPPAAETGEAEPTPVVPAVEPPAAEQPTPAAPVEQPPTGGESGSTAPAEVPPADAGEPQPTPAVPQSPASSDEEPGTSEAAPALEPTPSVP